MSIVLEVLQRRLAPLHDDVRPRWHGFYHVGGLQLFFTGLQPKIEVVELCLTIGSDHYRQEGQSS